jgi:hypothetical protein
MAARYLPTPLVHVPTVFDAADQQGSVIIEDAECHTTVTGARDAPPGQLVPQWFRQPVRVRRQSRRDEFGDRGGGFVW